MAAIVALGYEAGSWLKVAVSTDVDNSAKQAQSQHPERVVPRAVLFAPDDETARRVVAALLADADARHQRLLGQCVAMPVGGFVSAVHEAAGRLGIPLITAAEWEMRVERGGW